MLPVRQIAFFAPPLQFSITNNELVEVIDESPRKWIPNGQSKCDLSLQNLHECIPFSQLPKLIISDACSFKRGEQRILHLITINIQ